MTKLVYAPPFFSLSLILLGICLVIMALTLPTNFAQAQPDAAEYIGVRECASCHREMENTHDETRHARTLQDPQASLADFSQGDDLRTVQFPKEATPRPFTLEDVAFVLGSGRYVQRYVYAVAEEQYRVFPAEWNTVDGQWQPFSLAASWDDPAYDWGRNCAGCHTTGMDNTRIQWEDEGVQCEACHGPGSNHADASDEAGARPTEEELVAIRAAIVVSPDAQICGQCHSRGVAADNRPYTVAYVPGNDLFADFQLASTDDPVHYWASGHSKQANMQFNEWLNTSHATSLEVVKNSDYAEDACLECHSGDYRENQALIASYEAGEREGEPPQPLTLETAQYGITCTTCHQPHSSTPKEFMLVDEPLCADCHRDTELTAGIHHPAQEMFAGQPIVDQVQAIPSSHAEADLVCTTCHMPTVPVAEGARSSHSLQVVLPSTAENMPPDTCSTCHTDLSTRYLTEFIQDIQDKTTNRVSNARNALEDAQGIEGWMVAAVDFVHSDGSLGVHNYAYTDALLDAVEVKLGLVPTVSTAGSTLITEAQLADPATCVECHRDEFRQWENSPHATASLNDNFLQEFASQGRPNYCMTCHASGYNPDTLQHQFEGVVCSTCHPPAVEGEHPPAPLAVVEDSSNCGTCHSGAHAPTYDEWLVSDHKLAGVDCVDCHTPHNNGLILGDVNATCGSCHQEALVDEVHMGDEMTCVDCHMNRRVTENGVHVISSGHTMSIDPSVCSECHGNTHLLTVQEANRSPETVDTISALQEEVQTLEEQAKQDRNTGIIGGALGAFVLVIVVAIMLRLRNLLRG